MAVEALNIDLKTMSLVEYQKSQHEHKVYIQYNLRDTLKGDLENAKMFMVSREF